MVSVVSRGLHVRAEVSRQMDGFTNWTGGPFASSPLVLVWCPHVARNGTTSSVSNILFMQILKGLGSLLLSLPALYPLLYRVRLPHPEPLRQQA